MPFAIVDGARIHHEIAGTGPPLVLVLPQSTGPSGHAALIEALARRHRVLTWQQRGTGRSDAAPPGQSIEALAGDLSALMQAVGFARAHLVCHSTGCGIGQALAAAHPARAASLVLAAPWTHADAHLTVMQNLRKTAAALMDPESYARFNAALLFPPQFRRAHEAGFARMAAAMRDQPQDAADIARRLDAILAFDARPLWRSIACPTLVLTARDDQLMPCWCAAETAAGIVGARQLEFDGGGHMLPETCRERFVDEVLAFLEHVPAGARA
jgi:aminoacrylate hydrolase